MIFVVPPIITAVVAGVLVTATTIFGAVAAIQSRKKTRAIRTLQGDDKKALIDDLVGFKEEQYTLEAGIDLVNSGMEPNWTAAKEKARLITDVRHGYGLEKMGRKLRMKG